MTGQQLITEVEILRGAIKTSNRDVLNRIFDLNDRLTTVKAKRNCVNCATECLGRLMILGKKYRNEEIPTMKGIINKTILKTEQMKLVQFRIPKPFRPFGHKKTYNNFNTSDEEVIALLSIEPQHRLRFTMEDGSPFNMDLLTQEQSEQVESNDEVLVESEITESTETIETQEQSEQVESNDEVKENKKKGK